MTWKDPPPTRQKYWQSPRFLIPPSAVAMLIPSSFDPNDIARLKYALYGYGPPTAGTHIDQSGTPIPSSPTMPSPKFAVGDEVIVLEDFTYDDRQFPAELECVVTSISPGGFTLSFPNGHPDQGNPSWNFTISYADKIGKPVDNRPKISLESVIMAEDKKKAIRAATSQIEHHSKIFDDWGFSEVFEKGTAVSLLFYGPPGTGKTLTAQAIADSLDLKLKIIQTAEVESSVPGQCERNIKQFFETAAKKKQLLLFDECDSLICDRNEVGMILGAQINALLTALEAYTGVVVFTTNRLGRMDPAFERRVSAKIEFEMPNEEQRRAIWERLIPKKAPLSEDVDFAMLAKFPLPGGNIKNVVLNAARYAAFLGKERIDEECFEHAIEKEVQGLKGFEAAFKRQPKLPQRLPRDAEMGREGGQKTIKRVMKKDVVKELTEGTDAEIEEQPEEATA